MSGSTVERRHEVRRTISHEFTSLEQFIDEQVTNTNRSGVFITSHELLPVGR
jgi:hypothetical protein